MQRSRRPMRQNPGKRVWIRKLDGPSTSIWPSPVAELLLAVVTDSIYLIKPESGKVVRKFSWKGDGVSQAECTREGIIAILRGGWPPEGNVRLVGLNERGIQFTQTCQAFVPLLHYSSETRLIYVSHIEGIDIRRPETGLLTCKIQRKGHPTENGLVDVKGSTIFVLTGDGYVYALRHPPVGAKNAEDLFLIWTGFRQRRNNRCARPRSRIAAHTPYAERRARAAKSGHEARH